MAQNKSNQAVGNLCEKICQSFVNRCLSVKNISVWLNFGGPMMYKMFHFRIVKQLNFVCFAHYMPPPLYWQGLNTTAGLFKFMTTNVIFWGNGEKKISWARGTVVKNYCQV